MSPLEVFVWSVTIVLLMYFGYGVPIVVYGVWRYRRRGLESEPTGPEWDPPFVSVLVAVKNEERVVGRLLESLTKLDYPGDSLEVIVAEDGSSDRTLDICKSYAERFPWVKTYHREGSNGKADALNFAFSKSKGEVIATFDADAVPEPECIKKALGYFDQPEVGAVYGRSRAINIRESLISRLLTYEMFLWGLVNEAKYALGLFVCFSGSNLYLRRSAIEKVGLWDSGSLTEDVELAARFAKARIRIRLAPFMSWSETPATLASMVRQRVRWSAGTFQTGLKHLDGWRWMPGLRAFDMQMVMLSPAIAALLITAGVLLGLGMVGIGVGPGLVLPLLVGLLGLGAVLVGSLLVAVLLETGPWGLRHFRMVLAAPFYAGVVALANVAGMVLLMFGFRKRLWYRTEKSGYTDV